MRVVSPVVLDAVMIVNNVLLLESASSNTREKLDPPITSDGRSSVTPRLLSIACILSAYHRMSCLEYKLSLLRVHGFLIGARNLLSEERTKHSSLP